MIIDLKVIKVLNKNKTEKNTIGVEKIKRKLRCNKEKNKSKGREKDNVKKQNINKFKVKDQDLQKKSTSSLIINRETDPKFINIKSNKDRLKGKKFTKRIFREK